MQNYKIPVTPCGIFADNPPKKEDLLLCLDEKKFYHFIIQHFKILGTVIEVLFFMTTHTLLNFATAYLIFILGVVLAASKRRIALFKAFLISFFLTPVAGIVALRKVSRKVMVTYYNPQNPCLKCPYSGEVRPEFCDECEFIGELHEKLSVKKRFSV
ncbi:MAG: hypothetical protein IH595_06280 [Bacteroidales bacterium]|nr:hypothetical protein [Bacteroidales bacterium]